MCQNLYGVFAFILLDTEKRVLFTGRDTYGVRPSFKLYTEDGVLAICSEAKGLLEIQTGVLENKKIVPIEPGMHGQGSTIEDGIIGLWVFSRHIRTIQSGTEKFGFQGALPAKAKVSRDWQLSKVRCERKAGRRRVRELETCAYKCRSHETHVAKTYRLFVIRWLGFEFGHGLDGQRGPQSWYKLPDTDVFDWHGGRKSGHSCGQKGG